MYKQGFTLIEIVVVMAIIAILAGLVGGSAMLARKRGSIAKAKAAIASMETAITMYQLDMVNYPSDTEGIKSLVETLTQNPGDSSWRGPYMGFKSEDLKDGEAVDPWGNPYRYNSSSPQHNTASYDLYSFGPDGPGGSPSDDITNW